MRYHDISDERLAELKEIFKKDGIEYETDAEYRDAAQNLLGFFDVLIEIDMEERARKRRLDDEPNGFSMAGEGRDCSLCERSVYESDGWFDRWGFKCSNCQGAINKRKIPGSICRDYKHEKAVPDTTLATKLDIKVNILRKYIREGKIVGRRIPNGPYMILKKDNPNLSYVLKELLGSSSI